MTTTISQQSGIRRTYNHKNRSRIKTESQHWCFNCESQMLFQTQCCNKTFITSGENRKDRGGSGPGISYRVLHALTRRTEESDTKSQRGESVRRLRHKPITAWTQTRNVTGWTGLNTSTAEWCILLNVMLIWGLHTATVEDYNLPRSYDVSFGKQLWIATIRRLRQFILFGLPAREYESTSILRNIDNYLSVNTV